MSKAARKKTPRLDGRRLSFGAEEVPTHNNDELSRDVDEIPLSEALPHREEEAYDRVVPPPQQHERHEDCDLPQPGAERIRGFSNTRMTSVASVPESGGHHETVDVQSGVVALAELVDDPVEATKIDLE